MNNNYIYLNDKNFLINFNNQKVKEQFIKIIFLDWEEKPIKEVQSLVISGSITIDGNSSMRRTCSLQVFIPSTNYSNITDTKNLFSINKKIYLEIGLKNNTKDYIMYDIFWFPLGVYVINNCSISFSNSGITANLSLKDKTCLLNGDCGGVIPASTQFDQYEVLDENGNYIITKPVISRIIREAMNHFGGENLSKIVISDIEDRIKMVMRWMGNNPIYFINDGNNKILTTNYEDIQGRPYKIFSYGEDIGYIYTDFTYPQELIANAGDNISSAVLDKIKNTLGNYEYFYDITGNWIFQEQKNYLNTSKSTIDLNNLNNNSYLIDISKGKSEYDFSNSPLIISYSNSPNFLNVKNDFVVWGIRKNANGNDVPIRFHLAIDKKPKIGNDYEVYFYDDPDDGLRKAKVATKVTNYNNLIKNKGIEGEFYLVTNINKVFIWDSEKYKINKRISDGYVVSNIELVTVRTTDWRSELYLQGIQAEPLGLESNYYYTELANEWPKLYDLQKSSIVENNKIIYLGGFKDEVLANPSKIDYFLDFIDTEGSLSQLNINNIGRRSKIINDNNINCIFEPAIPPYVLIENNQTDTNIKREECEKKNQSYIQVESSIYQSLSIGGISNSAYNKIKELLYEYTGYNESIQIQMIPIYNLEPNTRITLYNEESDISGDYIISNISIPFDINGTMTISANKALEKI